jgi:hypothetical protein
MAEKRCWKYCRGQIIRWIWVENIVGWDLDEELEGGKSTEK